VYDEAPNAPRISSAGTKRGRHGVNLHCPTTIYAINAVAGCFFVEAIIAAVVTLSRDVAAQVENESKS